MRHTTVTFQIYYKHDCDFPVGPQRPHNEAITALGTVPPISAEFIVFRRRPHRDLHRVQLHSVHMHDKTKIDLALTL